MGKSVYHRRESRESSTNLKDVRREGAQATGEFIRTLDLVVGASLAAGHMISRQRGNLNSFH